MLCAFTDLTGKRWYLLHNNSEKFSSPRNLGKAALNIFTESILKYSKDNYNNPHPINIEFFEGGRKFVIPDLFRDGDINPKTTLEAGWVSPLTQEEKEQVINEINEICKDKLKLID